MEDTYSMKDLTQNLIAEVKQKKFLEDLWNQNTIELNNYFKYSGQVEETKGEYKRMQEAEIEYKKFIQKNPNADIIQEYMHDRWLQNRYKSNKKDKELWEKN